MPSNSETKKAQNPFHSFRVLNEAIAIAYSLQEHIDIIPNRLTISQFEKVVRKYIADVQDVSPYISPEHQQNSAAIVDFRALFYALGVELFRIAMGTLPSKVASDIELLASDLNSDFSAIIKKLLKTSPEKRYQEIQDITQALDLCLVALRNNTNKAPCILIVDDSLVNRIVLRGMLESHGVVLHEAEDGEQCVKLFEEYEPQVILMDAVMPKMDGVEATKAIKSMANGQDTTIIMVTANREDRYCKAYLESGADRVMCKPIEKTTLFKTLNQFVPIPSCTVS